MKFLCDKCKTRYSIGDDRVRGKILKIRCKNCANVITVREGADAADDAGRPRTSTGQQPPVAAAAPKPPPALEEEWYVSIDGVQSGPLSLTNAQAWVSSKPFEADLHCWSEGFDDWLPVDKVSHFRGLRKAPAPAPRPPQRPSGQHKTAPPPIPAEAREPAPKPLFASTMASLEKAAASQPAMPAQPAITPQATKKGTPAIPAIAAKAPSGGIKTNGKPQPLSSGAAALAQAFQPEADAMTNIDSPAFNDDLATTAEPDAAVSARMAAQGASSFYGTKPAPARPDPFAARPAAKADPFAKPAAPKPFAAKPVPLANLEAKKPVVPIHNDDDDNLEIGEVSRVVNLKDLGLERNPTSVPRAHGNTGSMRAHGNTASMMRIGGNTASVQKLTTSELGMNVDPALASSLGAATGEPHADESIVARSFRERHRRGMMILIGASGLLVAGVVALFIFVVNKNDDEVSGGLGGTHQIDTSRPEDIVKRQLPPAPNAGSAVANNATKHWTRPNNVAQNPNGGQEELGGNGLKASEVEDMAAKQGEGTKRCYMRAQKGALGFEIADVKKIAVTLAVNKDGSVGDVQLSEHAGDTFGQCLIARIKGWKFRESGGGTFRISLAFSND